MTIIYDGMLTIPQQDIEEYNNTGQDTTDIISNINTILI